MLRPDTAGFSQVNRLIPEKKKKAHSDTSKFFQGSIFKYPNDAEQKKIDLPFHPSKPASQCFPESYPNVWDWELMSIIALQYTSEACAREGEWALPIHWAGQAEARYHEKTNSHAAVTLVLQLVRPTVQ